MPARQRPEQQEKRERRRHKTIAEDERGWAGQHGQRPANDEEKNYLAGNYQGEQPKDSGSAA